MKVEKAEKSEYLCSRNHQQTSSKMEENKQNMTPHYTKHDNMSIDMYTLDEAPTKKLLRGRALLNDEKREMMFVQNTPRGPRSVEVGRTLHSRYVCRPDGEYTVTVHFAANEVNIREQLLSETRTMVTAVQEHYKGAEAKRKATDRKRPATGQSKEEGGEE